MRDRELTGTAFAVFCAYMLSIAVPGLLLLPADSARFTLPAVPLCAIVAYASLRLAGIACSPSEKVVSLTFWVFTYIFLGICPLLQVSLRTFPLGGHYDQGLLAQSSFIVLAGLIAFDAGQRFAPLHLRALAVPNVLRRGLSKPTILLLAPAALLVAVFLLQRLGGMEALFLPRVQRSELLAEKFNTAEAVLLNQLARAPIYAVAMAALVVWLYGRRAAGTSVGFLWKAFCSLLLLATLVINNPISTARLMVGTIVLSLVFVLPWKRWHGAACVAGLVAGLILVFPLADAYRVSLDARVSEQWNQSSAADVLARKMDFDSYQQITNAAVLVDREGLQLGRQLGGALLFWVPRSMWPDKPVSTGELLGLKSGYSFTNLSAPLWAEFYVDGGLPLVVFGFLAYGMAVRTVEEWYRRGRSLGTVRVVSVLVPIYAGYQFFVLRGSLMPAVAYLAPIVLFSVLCSFGLPRWRAANVRQAHRP